MHALHYANELLKNFCKLAKQTEAITNYQKQVWLWLSIVWETLKLTRYQSKQFSFILYRTKEEAYAFNLCEQIVFIHGVKLFSTLKNSP